MKVSNKSMLIVSLFITFILGCYTDSFSQSLQFCEDVDNDGAPVNSSSVFNIDSKGGYLKFLTKLPYRVGTYSVIYEIYRIDEDGYESYDNTIYQDVDPSWTWFWKEVTFYKAGKYLVEVYDGDRNFLTSGQIRIQYY